MKAGNTGRFGGLLLATGAIVRRYVKRDADRVEMRESALLHAEPGAARLPDAPAADFVAKSDQPTDVRVPKQR